MNAISAFSLVKLCNASILPSYGNNLFENGMNKENEIELNGVRDLAQNLPAKLIVWPNIGNVLIE